MPESREVAKSDKGRSHKTQQFESSIADRFLYLAIEDLEASILLYHRGHYPQAVFLLQQSVEKMVKSLGFFFTIINSKEANTVIGHKPLNLLKKTSLDIANMVHKGHRELGGVPEVQKFFKEVGFDSAAADASIDAKVAKIIDDLKKTEEYDLSKKHLRLLVKGTQKRSDKNHAATQKILEEGLTDSAYVALRKNLEDLVGTFLQSETLFPLQKNFNPIKTRDLVVSQILPNKESTESNLIFVQILGDCALALIPLARITAPHAVRSRYPISDECFDPLEYYTHDRPVVAVLPDLYPLARRAAEQIDLLYDLMAEYNPKDPALSENDLKELIPGGNPA
jgi:hypothetical protein